MMTIGLKLRDLVPPVSEGPSHLSGYGVDAALSSRFHLVEQKELIRALHDFINQSFVFVRDRSHACSFSPG